MNSGVRLLHGFGSAKPCTFVPVSQLHCNHFPNASKCYFPDNKAVWCESFYSILAGQCLQGINVLKPGLNDISHSNLKQVVPK